MQKEFWVVIELIAPVSIMNNLIKVVELAVSNKPKLGEECNSCGYCCLVEVCCVGQELTGKGIGPCELLITEGEKHTCKLADNETTKKALGIGTGCCAETQAEAMTRLVGGER